jgi:metal-sulfur cluster biosynthetic enzyme
VTTASAKVRKCESARVEHPVFSHSRTGGEAGGVGDALSHSGGGTEVERLWDALREVMDPEIPISLVDLGLIYDIRVDGGTVDVDFTYTATACPCAHFIQWDIAERLQREPGVEDIRLHEVWDPPWTKARVTPEGRQKLKELGVSL